MLILCNIIKIAEDAYMADEAIINIVRRYLDILNENGIRAEKAILYGSYARGDAGEYSDIDILVLSEQFDQDRWEKNSQLWRLTLDADMRIQPIPVGVRQFLEDDESIVIEMARREGIAITRN